MSTASAAQAPGVWIEAALARFRATPTYRSRVIDEWYETLPTPMPGPGVNHCLVVAFGGHRGPQRQAQPPHLLVELHYPHEDLSWHELTPISATSALWSADSSPLPQPQTPGSVMERRRRYYRSLSTALALGAFADAPLSAEACATLREVQQQLLDAASPALSAYYRAALQRLQDWAQARCPRSP